MQREAQGRPEAGVKPYALREGREKFLEKAAVMFVEPGVAALPDIDHGRIPAAPTIASSPDVPHSGPAGRRPRRAQSRGTTAARRGPLLTPELEVRAVPLEPANCVRRRRRSRRRLSKDAPRVRDGGQPDAPAAVPKIGDLRRIAEDRVGLGPGVRKSLKLTT